MSVYSYVYLHETHVTRSEDHNYYVQVINMYSQGCHSTFWYWDGSLQIGKIIDIFGQIGKIEELDAYIIKRTSTCIYHNIVFS